VKYNAYHDVNAQTLLYIEYYILYIIYYILCIIYWIMKNVIEIKTDRRYVFLEKIVLFVILQWSNSKILLLQKNKCKLF